LLKLPQLNANKVLTVSEPMKNYYEDKMNFHFKEYQLSVDSNKTKSAEYHMREYLNYKEMFDNKDNKQ